MLDLLWGWKTTALFDVWSIDHFMSGVSLGSAVIATNHKQLKLFWESKAKHLRKGEYAKVKKFFTHKKSHIAHFDVVAVLCVAYIWETLEHYLEAGAIPWDRMIYWFQGVEFWANRLITDPLMVLLGYLVAKRFPRTVWPARVFIVLWLFVHIFVFDHCMVLHEILWPGHPPS